MGRAENQVRAIVAGHVCLDIIPALDGVAGGLESVTRPGVLVNVGPAMMATGGAVANTGLALHRLGVPVKLMGKIGDDLIGRAILEVFRGHDPALADGMIVVSGEHSSYTIVLNPPGVDRVLLHCPGANDTFAAADVTESMLGDAGLFHFGYPPLMKRMFLDGGSELRALLTLAKEAGLTTSLDMSRPDPASESGRADWPRLLSRVLPRADVFLPSLDEIIFMLDMGRAPTAERSVDGRLLSEVGRRLLDEGCAVVGLKMGDQGLYLRTTDDLRRLTGLGRCVLREPADWVGRELLAPCFDVRVAGTTGAGDCTIAGFLAGLLRACDPAGGAKDARSPEAAATAAVAVGACCVERPDATSGVPHWDKVQQRIGVGWPRRRTGLDLRGWTWDEKHKLWFGPHDRTSA